MSYKKYLYLILFAAVLCGTTAAEWELGDSEPVEANNTIEFNQPIFSLLPGQKHIKTFEINNHLDEEDTVEVFVPQDHPACQVYQVETGLNTDEFGNSGEYELESAFNNNNPYAVTARVSIDMPSRPGLEEIAGDSNRITCAFVTQAENGQSEDLIIEAKPGGIAAQIEGLLDFQIPTLNIMDRICLETEKTTAGQAACPGEHEMNLSISPTLMVAAGVTIVGIIVLIILRFFGRTLIALLARISPI